jgi:hypothetical protein
MYCLKLVAAAASTRKTANAAAAKDSFGFD